MSACAHRQPKRTAPPELRAGSTRPRPGRQKIKISWRCARAIQSISRQRGHIAPLPAINASYRLGLPIPSPGVAAVHPRSQAPSHVRSQGPHHTRARTSTSSNGRAPARTGGRAIMAPGPFDVGSPIRLSPVRLSPKPHRHAPNRPRDAELTPRLIPSAANAETPPLNRQDWPLHSGLLTPRIGRSR